MRLSSSGPLIVAGLLSAAPALTHAAGPAPRAAEWSASLGAVTRIQPTYEGSKHYQVTPLPLAEVSWRDTVSLGLRDGLKITLRPLEDRRLSVSGSVGYWQGRREGADKDNGDALRGLGTLSGNAVARLGTDYRIGALSAGATVARDLGGDRDGTTLTLKTGYLIYRGSGLRISADLSTTLADSNHMDAMFGITPLQAARSPKRYAVHDAGAGVKDVSVGLTAGYTLLPSLDLFVRAEAGRLVGDAADSPIVRDAGSENQFSGGLGLSYRF